MIIIVGWNQVDEISHWCSENVGYLIWTNNISDWIGHGWYVSRVSNGLKLRIDNEEKRLLAALLWT
jgi:hypothetical protein